MTECSTPPSEEVEWCVQWFRYVRHGINWYEIHEATARTAWQAHQQVKGAPAFGSCRVVRVTTEEKT